MGKKKEYVETPENGDEFEYYEENEETEETVVEEPKKVEKNDKKLEVELLKAQNEAKKLELETKKLEFETKKLENDQKNAEANRDLELKRINNEKEIEDKKVKIEEGKAEAEKKASKRDLIAKWGTAGIGLIGTGLGIYFSRKAFLESMLFEESGSFRTSVSKKSQAMTDNVAKKLENVRKDI